MLTINCPIYIEFQVIFWPKKGKNDNVNRILTRPNQLELDQGRRQKIFQRGLTIQFNSNGLFAHKLKKS